jgi:hypothetical protein
LSAAINVGSVGAAAAAGAALAGAASAVAAEDALDASSDHAAGIDNANAPRKTNPDSLLIDENPLQSQMAPASRATAVAISNQR